MKNIIKLLSVFIFSLMFVCCFTTASVSEQNRAQVEQNRQEGLPLWADCSFSSTDVEAYIPGYKNNQVGLYSSGKGETSSQARLDARAKLAYWCKKTYKFNSSASADTLSGSRAVDTFTAPDGTVYVLMFISQKDAKKSFGG